MKCVKMLKLALVVLFICFGISGLSQAQDELICGQDPSILGGEKGWELAKDKDGIKVYLRQTPLSPIRAFKGVAEVDVDFSRLVALIWDGEGYIDWLILCNESKLLNTESDTEQILYTMNKPPWPVKKRDNILHRTISQDPETLAVTIQMCLLNDYLPEKKGHVRVPLLTGYGKITPLGNGKAELIYEVLVDVGGAIPKWIQNFCVVNTPYATIQNIRKMLPLDKYRGVKYGFLKYPEGNADSQVMGMLENK